MRAKLNAPSEKLQIVVTRPKKSRIKLVLSNDMTLFPLFFRMSNGKFFFFEIEF